MDYVEREFCLTRECRAMIDGLLVSEWNRLPSHLTRFVTAKQWRDYSFSVLHAPRNHPDNTEAWR